MLPHALRGVQTAFFTIENFAAGDDVGLRFRLKLHPVEDVQLLMG